MLCELSYQGPPIQEPPIDSLHTAYSFLNTKQIHDISENKIRDIRDAIFSTSSPTSVLLLRELVIRIKDLKDKIPEEKPAERAGNQGTEEEAQASTTITPKDTIRLQLAALEKETEKMKDLCEKLLEVENHYRSTKIDNGRDPRKLELFLKDSFSKEEDLNERKGSYSTRYFPIIHSFLLKVVHHTFLTERELVNIENGLKDIRHLSSDSSFVRHVHLLLLECKKRMLRDFDKGRANPALVYHAQEDIKKFLSEIGKVENDEHLPKLIELIRADKILLEWFYPLFFARKLEELNGLSDARSANPHLSKEMPGMHLIQKRLTRQLVTLESNPDPTNVILVLEKSLYKYTDILSTNEKAEQELPKLIGSDKEGNLYERVASGKAKIVWLPLSKEQPDTVYYTPTKQKKVKELEYELEVAKKVREKLLANALLGAYHGLFPEKTNHHLAQQVTLVLPPIGRYLQIHIHKSDLCINESNLTISAPQAICDAEFFIRRQDFSLNQAIYFADQLIEAMVDLHDSNRIHGDLKPENLLVIGEPPYTLQLSDWGKTTKHTHRTLHSDKLLVYSGNPRFAAPEAFASRSQPGDVFSTGLILIRFLEEPLLKQKQKEMLIQPTQEKKLTGSIKGLRGIEKFVVLNYECPQSNHNLGRLNAHVNDYPNAENEIHKYIDELIQELSNQYTEQANYYIALGPQLKFMLQSDPTKRPTIKIIQETFNALKDNLRTL